MQSSVLHPPKTLLEVYRMLPEGTRAELINDQLFMSPAPSLSHQDVISALIAQFHNFIVKKKLGKVYPSPVDVFLNQKNAVQPDIVVVLNENSSILKPDGIHGAPDLIVEILSPGTEDIDRGLKKRMYEKVGVKEYWIIDPSTKECFGFELKKGKLVDLKKSKGKLSSILLHHTFKF